MTESVIETVKTETAKQTVQLLFAVAGVVILAVVSRHVTQPDNWKTTKMQAYDWLSKFARRQQHNCEKLSEWADLQYVELREW